MGRRLRRLETRIGATLFEQTREGQVLTEAGEALLVEVEAMERAASRIAEQGGGGEQGLARRARARQPVRRFRQLDRRTRAGGLPPPRIPAS